MTEIEVMGLKNLNQTNRMKILEYKKPLEMWGKNLFIKQALKNNDKKESNISSESPFKNAALKEKMSKIHQFIENKNRYADRNVFNSSFIRWQKNKTTKGPFLQHKLWKKNKFRTTYSQSQMKMAYQSKRKSKVCRSQKQLKSNRSSNASKAPTQNNVIRLSKHKIIDGVEFIVTVEIGKIYLLIIGYTEQVSEPIPIQIDIGEALNFIKHECEGRMDKIFQHLRFDIAHKVLYLVASDSDFYKALIQQRPLQKNQEEQEWQKVADGKQGEIREVSEKEQSEDDQTDIPIQSMNKSLADLQIGDITQNTNKRKNILNIRKRTKSVLICPA